MRVLLDGHHLHSAAEVYDALAPALGFPPHFGANPDALWDVLSERGPSDLAIVWRHAGRSAVELGADYERLVAVLNAAADAGLLSFERAEFSKDYPYRRLPDARIRHSS